MMQGSTSYSNWWGDPVFAPVAMALGMAMFVGCVFNIGLGKK